MFILIVDDEENITLALKTMIAKKIPDANIVCVSDGFEATKIYKTEKVDLILSDWNMPIMSGKDLLHEIRINNSDSLTPFLMLTARADADSVQTAISSGVTGYIAKPFDKEVLLNKVQSLLQEKTAEENIDNASVDVGTTIQNKIIDIIRVRIKKDYIKFPVLPEVAFKAVSVINADDASMSEVASIVKIDTALSGKVLSLASSIYYRAQQPLESLEEAMARIGLRETMSAVLIYAMKELYKETDKGYSEYLRNLWETTLLTASAARELAKITHYKSPDVLYSLAMFFDIGKLTILPILMELKKARSGVSDEIVHDVMHALGNEVGVMMLKHWGFSESFIDVAKVQCDFAGLGSATKEALLIVMASSIGHDIIGCHNVYDQKLISLLQSELSLSDERIKDIRTNAKNYLKEIKESLVS